METRVFRTNLNCNKCVAKVTPLLNAEPSVSSWSVDIADSRKPLSVQGQSIQSERVRALVREAGFEVFEEILHGISSETAKTPNFSKTLLTYFPLILIFAYLLGIVMLVAWKQNDFSSMSLMSHFMGGFFLVFSFFKLLNLKGFADSYTTYDVLAKRFKAYAYIYPFIELGLGMSYLLGVSPWTTNLITVLVMGVSSIGVLQSLLKKQAIRCACLGTVFNLPMSTITLFEDLLMLVMAAIMLFPSA